MYLVVPPGGCFRETRRIELGPNPLRIGRAEANDVRVDVPGVDDEHARISEIALIAIGADCAIGDVPLDTGARRLVMPGDEIQIGSVVVALEGDDPSLQSSPPAEGDPSPRQNPGPKVRVVEGANFGDELVLAEEGREYVVGRHGSCDLVLEDREVSREHLRVKRRGYSVFIQDLSSTRGSWLGRAPLYPGATVEWLRPRMLRVGATVLSLELPAEIRRAAHAAQVSAPMTPEPRRRQPLPGHETPQSSPSAQPSPANSPPAPSGDPAAPPPIRQVTERLLASPPPPAPPNEGSGAVLAAATAPAASAHVASLTIPGPSRKAWKKQGAMLSRRSAFLLAVLAVIVIVALIWLVFYAMD